MGRNTILRVLAAVACAAPFPALRAASIRASRESDGTIRVVVPGKFETTFTRPKGFVSTWYDLKHDPKKQRDIAPVADENGILWTKARGGDLTGDGSWYANPADKLELLEAGPVRARVRASGPHRKYGRTRPELAWTALGFEQTFTLYASGDVYVDYALLAEKPTPLHHFLLIIKSTGAWGKSGKGEGKGEVHCAGAHGEKKPSRWSKTKSPLALQWSDGPTYFQDILLVMYKGIYNGSYWNEGFRDRDLRAGLSLTDRWPDKTIPKGKDHIRLLMRFDDGINSPAAAKPFADDYRSPDRLAVAEGTLDKSDEGDRDADGFNEEEGCYVLEAVASGVAFTLHGAKIHRMEPAFKVKGWRGLPPATVALGSEKLAAGGDFNASVQDGVLLLQILRQVSSDLGVVVRKP